MLIRMKPTSFKEMSLRSVCHCLCKGVVEGRTGARPTIIVPPLINCSWQQWTPRISICLGAGLHVTVGALYNLLQSFRPFSVLSDLKIIDCTNSLFVHHQTQNDNCTHLYIDNPPDKAAV